MSEARAITNLIGNGIATIFISHTEKLLEHSKMHKAFSKESPLDEIAL
jgi:aerobic C4-dicarboxylate transport protein